ncbi:Transcriptional regulator BlaI [compost metagenome]
MKKWIKHLRQFKPDANGPESVLGDLETAVMEAGWSLGEFGIKDVHDALKDRAIAYTTVQTTIERLYRKGLLSRLGRGRSFVYSPAVNREEFLAGVAKRMLDSLFGNFNEPTMASLVDVLEAQNPEALDRLAQLIDERRKRGEA